MVYFRHGNKVWSTVGAPLEARALGVAAFGFATRFFAARFFREDAPELAAAPGLQSESEPSEWAGLCAGGGGAAAVLAWVIVLEVLNCVWGK